LFLLAPDLSEASVAGLVTIKRQVEEAKADAARAQADAATAHAELSALQAVVARAELSATQQVSAQQHTTINPGGGIVEVLEWMSKNDRLVTAAEKQPSEPKPPNDDVDERPAVAEARVAIANRAFEALPAMLPRVWADGTVLGVVDGDPRVVYTVGPIAADEAEARLEASGLLASAASTGRPVAAERTDKTPAMAAAPALNAEGRQVGTFAVVTALGEDAPLDAELGAQLEQAANAFARIVVDLLRLDDDSPGPTQAQLEQAE